MAVARYFSVNVAEAEAHYIKNSDIRPLNITLWNLTKILHTYSVVHVQVQPLSWQGVWSTIPSFYVAYISHISDMASTQWTELFINYTRKVKTLEFKLH